MGQMQIGRWGNSLAVRLPRDLTERFKLKDGDMLKTDGIERDLEADEAAQHQRRPEAALEWITKNTHTIPAAMKKNRDEKNWRPAMDRW